jgi:hypothetical protein
MTRVETDGLSGSGRRRDGRGSPWRDPGLGRRHDRGAAEVVISAAADLVIGIAIEIAVDVRPASWPSWAS